MVVVLVVMLGALAGQVVGAGAVVGGLLAWLGFRTFEQQKRLDALARELDALRREGSPAPAAELALHAAAATVAAAPAETAVPDEAPPESPPPAPPPPAPAPPLVPAGTPLPQSPSESGLLDRARAWLLGGNTIAKVGIGILFLGLAFLSKYVAEHAQFPVEFRLAGIGGVALALLAVGWRLRRAQATYAQVLQGGAVAVLYLTLFAAFRFYGVMSAAPSFTLMIGVAVLSAVLAVLQHSVSLALLGALGGFSTPLLLASGGGNHVALFSLYLVLCFGIALVAWFRTWRALNAVGFVFTFGVAAAWGLASYQPGHYAESQIFLIAFFLLFNAVMLMPARQAPVAGLMQRLEVPIQGSLLFGLPTITFALQHGLVHDTAYGSAISAFVLAVFYAALALAIRRRPPLAVAFDGAVAVATVFLILVAPLALATHATAAAWALQGAGLLWLGLRQQSRVLRAFGYGLFLLSSVALVLSPRAVAPDGIVTDAWFLGALMISAACMVAALFVFRARGGPVLVRDEARAEVALIGLGTLWALAAAHRPIEAFFNAGDAVTAWLVAAPAIAGIMLALARWLRWPHVRVPTVLLAPALGILLLSGVSWLESPAARGGWWAWPLALAVQFLVLRDAAPAWPATLRHAVHAFVAVLLAGLGALQGAAVTRGWGDAAGAWPWLGWVLVPALLLALLTRDATARRWPVCAEPQAWRSSAGGALAAGTLLWTVLANGMSNGSAAPLPHVPLLNPLDVGIGLALAVAWTWLRSDAAQPMLRHRPDAGVMLLAGCVFLWLNAVLFRGFHHYAAVPFSVEAWIDSLAVQTGVTLLWAVMALVSMWVAARRAARGTWILGASLLAAVVVKLLLIDLSGSGTLARIVSFIGVGLLMLVIAYVAPLPSPADSEREAH